MPTVFEKLNLKNHKDIVVLNAPQSFEGAIKSLGDVNVHRDAAEAKTIEFSLAFVTKQKEIDFIAMSVARKTTGDAVVWFAYPKGSSKKYQCDFNRDHGWDALGKAGFEPVRMVAIDEDWSAVRFRRTEFIKTMTRAKEHRISPQGRAKKQSR
jgi:hypothetical protein